MEKVSFLIYTPDGKKIHWSSNIILVPLWLVPIFIAWVFEDDFKKGSELHYYLMLFYFFLAPISIGFLVASFWRLKPLNGIINGEIEFGDNYIKVDDQVLLLENITDLNFKFRDYYGMPSTNLNADFNPRISRGVNNYVTFTDNSGQSQMICFQLLSKKHFKELAPFINAAIKGKKMEFKNGIELVGIENVTI